LRGPIQSLGLIAHRDQSRARRCIGAGEQGDVMGQLNQGVGQVGDHPFRAAIQIRGQGLIERRDLRELHERSRG
tara:strand:- start:33141 stop:33362 length:222 start_codon:yes stop_codon:yes gene_type:complete